MEVPVVVRGVIVNDRPPEVVGWAFGHFQGLSTPDGTMVRDLISGASVFERRVV